MELTQEISEAPQSPYRRILGVDFFCGTPEEAVGRVRGGLVVVPAAPALVDLTTSRAYRDALLQADLVISDSSFMVHTWNLLQRDKIRRLSGLAYLRRLLHEPAVKEPGNTLWVMANQTSAARNLLCLNKRGIRVPDENVYVAPIYNGVAADDELKELINRLRPQHVILTLGGGTQELLGLYLKRNLDYVPTIHCIGAAIAFLSGDQIMIPVWADKCRIGFLFRVFSDPKRQLPRYWKARSLFVMIWRFRDGLPPLVEQHRNGSLPIC